MTSFLKTSLFKVFRQSFCAIAIVLALPGAAESIPTYKVGTLVSFPPFTLLDETGGSSGFDIELLRAMGERAGFKIDVQYQTWKASLPMLDDGSRDIIATGVVINEERAAKYDFSDPYLETGWTAVLRDGSEDGKEKMASFKEMLANPDLVWTTEDGGAGAPMLDKMLADKPNERVTSGSMFFELKDVLIGKADVAYDISSVFKYYIKNNSDIQSRVYTFTDPEAPISSFGFAVKKGNHEVIEKLNAGLKAVKEDGTYQKLVDKWFH